MRSARIVGDEAVAIIIEPEELQAVLTYIGHSTPGDHTLPNGIKVAHALYAKLVQLTTQTEDQLIYENKRDLPAYAEVEPPIEANWS